MARDIDNARDYAAREVVAREEVECQTRRSLKTVQRRTAGRYRRDGDDAREIVDEAREIIDEAREDVARDDVARESVARDDPVRVDARECSRAH